MRKRTKTNKYPIVIGAEIDLHGLSRESARRLVTESIMEARAAGHRHIRIIVGKGLHSGETGSVLGPAIKSLLNESGVRYRESKREDGGEGALIVQLA